MRKGYSTPLVIAIMAFSVVSFLFLIDTSINPEGARKSTNSNTANLNAPANQNANTVANNNTKTATDPTAGWNVFTNTKYLYSLRLPPNWKPLSEFDGTEIPGTTFMGNSYLLGKVGSSGNFGLTISAFTIGKIVEGYPNSLNQWKQNKSITSEQTTTLGSESFKKIKLNDDPTVWYLTEHGLFFFVIRVQDTDITIADQILSTFTFTDPTAGWKTYTNATYEYSILYPSDWPLDSKNVSAVTIGTVPFEPGPGSLSVIAYPNKTVEQRLTELKANYIDGCTSETPNQVAGLSGKSLQCRGAFAGEPHEITLLNNASITYEFTYVSGNPTTDLVIKQILSSFTFTDPTGGWKTYVNNEFYFSFKYPADWELTQDSRIPSFGAQDPSSEDYINVAPNGGPGIGYQDSSLSSTTVMIAGKTAMKQVWTIRSTGEIRGCYYEFPAAPVSSWKAGGSVVLSCDESEAEKQILATFTFTD